MRAQARLSGRGANFNNFKLLSCAAIAETTTTRIWQYYQQQLQPSMGVSISLSLCVLVCVCMRQQTSDSDSDRDVFEYCKNLMKCNHLENPANTFIVIASCYNSATTMARGEPKRERARRKEGSGKPCQWLNWHTVHVVHMLPLGNTFVSPFLFVTNLQFRFFTLFKFICHLPISHRLTSYPAPFTSPAVELLT